MPTRWSWPCWASGRPRGCRHATCPGGHGQRPTCAASTIPLPRQMNQDSGCHSPTLVFHTSPPRRQRGHVYPDSPRTAARVASRCAGSDGTTPASRPDGTLAGCCHPLVHGDRPLASSWPIRPAMLGRIALANSNPTGTRRKPDSKGGTRERPPRLRTQCPLEITSHQGQSMEWTLCRMEPASHARAHTHAHAHAHAHAHTPHHPARAQGLALAPATDPGRLPKYLYGYERWHRQVPTTTVPAQMHRDTLAPGTLPHVGLTERGTSPQLREGGGGTRRIARQCHGRLGRAPAFSSLLARWPPHAATRARR